MSLKKVQVATRLDFCWVKYLFLPGKSVWYHYIKKWLVVLTMSGYSGYNWQPLEHLWASPYNCISKYDAFVVILSPRCSVITTLQEQVGFFDHKVVTLVADKLERQWLWKVCFAIED